MSKKITLTSGATITIKDAGDLKVKDRNRIMRAGDSKAMLKKVLLLVTRFFQQLL